MCVCVCVCPAFNQRVSIATFSSKEITLSTLEGPEMFPDPNPVQTVHTVSHGTRAANSPIVPSEYRLQRTEDSVNYFL